MIGRMLDTFVGLFSPQAGLQRMQARRVMRHYSGAESNRLTNHSKPKNQSANSELAGPFGADALRAWARKLVRDNAYAWGVVDSIVSSVVENGIQAQSTLESDEGYDVEGINWTRDAVWDEWCEVCDLNGQFTYSEIQRLAQREMVEAGEVLIHFVKTPDKTYRGITRPVPLALELIEADRLATDYDTYKHHETSNRIVRGIELDDLGKPVAYHIYPQHPNDVSSPIRNEPKRIPAADIQHLFRRDRIGQTRGVSWFAPVLSWLRDLGVYVDNELQASAVAACFSVFIRTDGSPAGLNGMEGGDTADSNGNRYEFLEPGQVMYGSKDEGVDVINTTRPNSGSQPWIELMLRGIAVGTGLSYEVVARDYSKTNYSSSRTSQLEDRRRFRCWQRYLVNHLCQPTWDRFYEAAATAGLKDFPTATELLSNRRKVAPVEWQTPEWEWVDPTAEQSASQASIEANQSTYATECGSRGRNWKSVAYQRAKEQALFRKLGLGSLEQKRIDAEVEAMQQGDSGGARDLNLAESLQKLYLSVGKVITTQEAREIVSAQYGIDLPPENAPSGGEPSASGGTTSGEVIKDSGTGEMSETSRLQWNRNQKAIDDILQAFATGSHSRARANVMLSALGLSSKNVDMLLDDAADGTIDGKASEEITT